MPHVTGISGTGLVLSSIRATERNLPGESVKQLQPALVDDPPGPPPLPFVADNARQGRQRHRDEPQHPEEHQPGGFSLDGARDRTGLNHGG